jgi:hypothetical protein
MKHDVDFLKAKFNLKEFSLRDLPTNFIINRSIMQNYPVSLVVIIERLSVAYF